MSSFKAFPDLVNGLLGMVKQNFTEKMCQVACTCQEVVVGIRDRSELTESA